MVLFGGYSPEQLKQEYDRQLLWADKTEPRIDELIARLRALYSAAFGTQASHEIGFRIEGLTRLKHELERERMQRHWHTVTVTPEILALVQNQRAQLSEWLLELEKYVGELERTARSRANGTKSGQKRFKGSGTEALFNHLNSLPPNEICKRGFIKQTAIDCATGRIPGAQLSEGSAIKEIRKWKQAKGI